MLPPDDLSWLDEGIHRSDESDGDGGDDDDDNCDGGDGGGDDDGGYGGDDEESHGVGGSQRGCALTWDSEYYAT